MQPVLLCLFEMTPRKLFQFLHFHLNRLFYLDFTWRYLNLLLTFTFTHAFITSCSDYMWRDAATCDKKYCFSKVLFLVIRSFCLNHPQRRWKSFYLRNTYYLCVIAVEQQHKLPWQWYPQVLIHVLYSVLNVTIVSFNTSLCDIYCYTESSSR